MATDDPPFSQEHFWSDRDPKDLIGWVVASKYRIVRHIGGGGFGEVYEALNIHFSDQSVVVKFLKHVASRQRFLLEGRILCRLRHPNICPVIDFFPVEGALVMQFIDGVDAERLRNERGSLDDALILSIARSIANAIAYAHSCKIAHRDTKPSNVLIDRFGHAYLIDFGIAKEIGANTQTKTGHMVLTPQYAAPERLMPVEAYNPFLSDIFELGATIYWLATGTTPFDRIAGRGLSSAKGATTPPISRRMTRVLRKATAQDPADRYQSAAEFAEALRNTSRVYRRPAWPVVGAACVLLLALAGAAYLGRTAIARIFAPPDQTAAVKVEPVDSGTVGVDNSVFASFEADSNSSAADDSLPDSSAVAVSTPVEPPAEEEAVAPAESVVAQQPPPSPEPRVIVHHPRLTLVVTPSDMSTVLVDGTLKRINTPFDVRSGNHEIRVYNPHFPLVIDTLAVHGDNAYRVSLDDRFRNFPRVRLILGLSGISTEDWALEMSLNGFSRQLHAFPDAGTYLVRGPWEVAFSVESTAGGRAEVDSVVFCPEGPPEAHAVFSGAKRIIDFNDPRWKDRQNLPVTIYGHRIGS